jgi:hypothetical protein
MVKELTPLHDHHCKLLGIMLLITVDHLPTGWNVQVFLYLYDYLVPGEKWC